ncbi:protein CLT2, chloroplastic-like isoform X2 [Triticum dicoccoides]|uniref:protein CLT2, chloroplastic-like isoform X2 n=1 Tax=Triticum dicoccoides TaxID=85692 RepID=UPI000E78F660|nr:protein CLT2, chloroplastic-like isoform X2 [Triticum dicoccoides]
MPMSSSPAVAVAVASAAVVALAVANRVLYKLALVPLKSYPFLLAQLTTFGYVTVYFSILYARYRAGVVTRDMLTLPKIRFAVIGLLEALGVAAGMSAGAMLPGPAIPILSQSFLVWQLIFSVLLLGKTYSLRQIIGCLLVTSGVILAVASGANDGHLLSGVKLIWPLLMVVSSAFQAGASILKGKRPDIFVVNSFGSGFQALFVFLLLPLLSNLRGIKLAELSGHLNGGAECFLNVGESPIDCGGAPFLPLLFIFVNMAFNISLLNLVKMSSAVVASLTATSAVPISIYIHSLPLPYIPQGAELSASFIFGGIVLLMGLILYNLPQSSKESKTD